MNTVTDQPMSRRDVWLTIALAIAKGYIPIPEDFDIRDDIKSVDLVYNGRIGNPDPVADATKAAAHLNLGEPTGWGTTHRVWWENFGAWSYNVRAYLADPEEPSSLAEQLIEAIG